MTRIARPSRAVTIIEVITTITVASIIAVTVVPAVGRIGRARQDAGVFELARLIEHARTLAATTGAPHAITTDAATDSVSIVRTDGVAVTPAYDALGQPESPAYLTADFGADLVRVSINRPAIAPSGLDLETLWFAHDRTPHIRTSAGSFGVDLDSDASFEFATGSLVTVRAWSGLVEVTP